MEFLVGTVCWDANFRYIYDRSTGGHWSFNKFSGTRWHIVRKDDRKRYLANSYRVLLTRARQGMVVFVPFGHDQDPTRPARYYDDTFRFLLECGLEPVEAGND
jgi:hypothetical protein